MRRVAALLALVMAIGFLVVAGRGEAAAPAPGDGDRWAVVVGVSKYAGRTQPTVGGAGDAYDVTAALEQSGFPRDHIVTLVDSAATAGSIRNALDWLRSNASSSSLSVFHFSGHVKQARFDDGDGERVDEALWPHDNQFIPDGELASRLRDVPGWLWVDIAGCEAAGFDDGLSGPRRLVTASSAETEKSYEYPDWRNSVFTGLLVDQGMLQRMADFDGDGRVSIHEAFHHAWEQAPAMTHGQRRGAQHPYAAGGDGEPWFLAPPPPPPQASQQQEPAPEPAPAGDDRTCILGNLACW